MPDDLRGRAKECYLLSGYTQQRNLQMTNTYAALFESAQPERQVDDHHSIELNQASPMYASRALLGSSCPSSGGMSRASSLDSCPNVSEPYESDDETGYLTLHKETVHDGVNDVTMEFISTRLNSSLML